MKKYFILITYVIAFLAMPMHTLAMKDPQSPLVDHHSYNLEITDTTRLQKAITYLEYLSKRQNIDSTLILSDRVIAAASFFKDSLKLGDAYRYQAMAYCDQNKYFYANKSLKKAIAVFKKMNHTRRLAAVFEYLYFVESYRGNLTEAADYLLEARMYYEQLNDIEGIAGVTNYLGDLYAKLEKFNLAEDAYKKAIMVATKIEGHQYLGLYMNNLAFLYINNNKPQQAKGIVHSALKLNKRRNYKIFTIYSYYIYAKIALVQKEYLKSEKYYDTVLTMGKTTTHFAVNIPLITSKQQLAKIAIATKQYSKAEKLLQQAEKEFLALEDIDPSSHLLYNYEIATKLDSARGRLNDALAWQRKYQQLSDEKINKITSEKIERAEERHLAEINYIKEIDAQEKKERQNEVKLLRYKTFTCFSLIASIVISIFLFFVIKTRKERKQLIASLDKSNKIKNKLFSIISHDLKNEIHGLDSSLTLMKDNDIPTEEFKEIIPLLANRTHQTSILLNNLLNWSKSQLKELNANPTAFDFTDVISDKFSFFKPKASQKNIQLINNLDMTQIYADKDMISIVAQNLIANAIKFCNPGDTIALESKECEKHFEIRFRDTGVGISKDHIHKLFAEETYTTKGTENESGTGLGLRICKELIELNQGSIKVMSTLGEGSTFCVSLPKAA